MTRLRLLSAAFVVPAFALFAAGCGGGDKPSEKPAPGTSSGTASTGGKSTAKSSGGPKEELASKGSGTAKGRVVFDGDPPKPELIDVDKLKPSDAPVCHKGPKEQLTDPTWRVGSDKGVANVVVWLQAPENKYFKIPDDMKSKADVLLDQPFCAFRPHVFVLFPTYFDGKAQKPTGQKLVVKNSAEIAHNTNITFEDPILNPSGMNRQMPAKNAPPIEIKDVLPCKERDCSKTQKVSIKCDVHQWMKAFGKAFDHPFVDISSGDKEGDKSFGNFEIKQAPAGVEVSVMYWHESMDKPAELKKVTLKEGDNDLGEIKIKK